MTPEQIQTIIARYPEGRQKSAVLPLLHLAQAENGGWLNREAMDKVAHLLNIQPIEVYEVATFYSMFELKPTGKYVLELCQTGPCCLAGSESIMTYLEKKLGITVGQTTPDGLFTIKGVECLASCGTAPVLRLGECYHERLDEPSVDALLDQLRTQAKGTSHVS